MTTAGTGRGRFAHVGVGVIPAPLFVTMSSSSANSQYANSPQYPNGHEDVRAGQHRIRTCNHCDEEYDEDDEVGDGYCSTWCRYNGIAYDALRSIRHDHTHCISCFRRLKILIPPGRNHRDSPEATSKTDRLSKDIPAYEKADHPGAIDVGGVVPTEVAEPSYQWDVGEEFRANPTEDDWEFLPRGLDSTKVCECGVAHHGTADYLKEDLSKREAIRRTERLAAILDERIDAGDWDHAYDTDALFTFVKKAKSRPGLQGDDKRIFQNALAFAVRRAE